MKFIADFHIHSRFSRATAKDFDLEKMYIAAQLKGITVIGTGDFTHPGWFGEIKEKLVPAEPGLFKLKEEIEKRCDQNVPVLCRGNVRFILVSEISNIYKKNNKTRKNHNLVFMPDLENAEKFNSKLDKIGNIKSDGRPILGLDARNLLEEVLDTSENAFLIPAHIWTPWFSILGSKSGFDSIEECFEDLTPNIFAVETGLSSDPSMNWRVSGLDGFTLVSNSDAHSPLKMGREANLFNTALSYAAIRRAMEFGEEEEFHGTIEFYPEEGKYHLDGHRKCNERLWPKETRSRSGKCSVCQKPLTLGVMYRVEELADRPEGKTPRKKHPFYNVIPLLEILSEVLQVGVGSKKVMKNYMFLIEKLGPELKILHEFEPEIIDRAGVPLIGEAVKRMREKKVIIIPGYDGEFGKIKIFQQQEREKLLGQKTLFVLPTESATFKKERRGKQQKEKKEILTKKIPDKQQVEQSEADRLAHKKDVKKLTYLLDLNKEQLRAVTHDNGPLMIVAGPGTGKTRTLTYKIAHLVRDKGVSPKNILAVTFTNKAAQELRHRLEQLLENSKKLPFVGTFHGLCFKLLNEHNEEAISIIDENDRKAMLLDVIKNIENTGIKIPEKPQVLLERIIRTKQQIRDPDEIDDVDGTEKSLFAKVYCSYQRWLSTQGLCDYEDLVFNTVRLFETDKNFLKKYRALFKFIFVDEYQDINHGQYRMIRALAAPGESNRDLCVIGDPDQSIYGFRGSDIKYFERFKNDYPKAEIVTLTRNYRSTQIIIKASGQVIARRRKKVPKARLFSEAVGFNTINIVEAGSDKAEAVAVGKTIEKLIGGIGFHSYDFGIVSPQDQSKNRSFSDFAVLYRTSRQSEIFSNVFERAGIPHQVVSRENIFLTEGITVLISLLKILTETGSYIDLERINKFTSVDINKRNMEIFKRWGYRNRFTLKEAFLNARRLPIKGMSRRWQTMLNGAFDNLLSMKKKIKEKPVEQKLYWLIENTRLSEIISNQTKTKEAFKHLVNISKTSSSNVTDFFALCALQSDTDTYESNSEKVSLMTMHAAKGLEFPVVFIVGCEEGYLPLHRPNMTGIDIEEELRLFYVAMTRAQERLYLTHAKKRRVYGKTETRTLSPFVGRIEDMLRTHEKPTFKKKRNKGSEQLKLF